MNYIVVVHTAEEGGYWAEVPALPGCFAQGDDLDAVLADARDAIAAHLAALRDDGQPLPDEPVVIATVRVEAASEA